MSFVFPTSPSNPQIFKADPSHARTHTHPYIHIHPQPATVMQSHSILNSISLNASRERMSELLSDFKKLSFDNEISKTQTKLPSNAVTEINTDPTSPETKGSLDNEESIEMVKKYDSPGKLVALYVGDLDPAVTEEKLYRFFSAYSSLSTVKICYLPGTKTSLGYGYVNFSSEKEAQRAIQELNYMPLLNKEIRIMPSLKGKEKSFLGTNVFISNLNTNKINSLRAFYDAFKAHGNILSCKLNLVKGQGFVSFEDKQTAHKVVKDMNGSILFGCQLHCTIHVPKAIRKNSFKVGSRPSSSSTLKLSFNETKDLQPLSSRPEYSTTSSVADKESTSEPKLKCQASESANQSFSALQTPTSTSGFKQIYVKCLPFDVTEEELKNLFGKCGPITDVYFQNITEFKSAWAMITFKCADCALQATRDFHRLIYKGRKLTCVKALKRSERQQQLAVKVPAITINKSKPHQKLYLYNLPPNVNENFFKLFMRGYTLQGSIIRFFITPKAYSSFIDFEKETDAKAVLLRLNGIELFGHIIKASLTKLDETPSDGSKSEPLDTNGRMVFKEGGFGKAPASSATMSAPPLAAKAVPCLTSANDSVMNSRNSSVAFHPPRFFSSAQLPPTQSHVFQDSNGAFYRLIPMHGLFSTTTSTRGSDVSPVITRNPSFKDATDFRGSHSGSESLLSTLEKMAPRYIDFMKYPSATRPKNLKRILLYFMDTHWNSDASLIKTELDKIQRGDTATELSFNNKLVQTIELLGYLR